MVDLSVAETLPPQSKLLSLDSPPTLETVVQDGACSQAQLPCAAFRR